MGFKGSKVQILSSRPNFLGGLCGGVFHKDLFFDLQGGRSPDQGGDQVVTMAPFDKETTEYTVKTAIYAIFMPPFYGDVTGDTMVDNYR